VQEGEAAAGRRTPALFEPPGFLRAHGRVRFLLVVAFLIAAGVAAYVGANAHPDSAPRNDSALERKVVSVFGDPTVKDADDKLTGDFLVERFYILDELTGERYIADFLKGTIEGVQNVAADNVDPSYVFLLGLTNLKRQERLINAYVNMISQPEDLAAGSYLGLTAATGTTDAFAMNYTGALPNQRTAFRGPEGEDLQTYLLNQKYETVTDSPHLVTVDGYNFLLSDSDAFLLFKNQYGLGRAVFVSELLIIDATSKADRTHYFRLLNNYPPRAGGR
jgi:hypothetical protein